MAVGRVGPDAALRVDEEAFDRRHRVEFRTQRRRVHDEQAGIGTDGHAAVIDRTERGDGMDGFGQVENLLHAQSLVPIGERATGIGHEKKPARRTDEVVGSGRCPAAGQRLDAAVGVEPLLPARVLDIGDALAAHVAVGRAVGPDAADGDLRTVVHAIPRVPLVVADEPRVTIGQRMGADAAEIIVELAPDNVADRDEPPRTALEEVGTEVVGRTPDVVVHIVADVQQDVGREGTVLAVSIAIDVELVAVVADQPVPRREPHLVVAGLADAGHDVGRHSAAQVVVGGVAHRMGRGTRRRGHEYHGQCDTKKRGKLHTECVFLDSAIAAVKLMIFRDMDKIHTIFPHKGIGQQIHKSFSTIQGIYQCVLYLLRIHFLYFFFPFRI